MVCGDFVVYGKKIKSMCLKANTNAWRDVLLCCLVCGFFSWTILKVGCKPFNKYEQGTKIPCSVKISQALSWPLWSWPFNSPLLLGTFSVETVALQSNGNFTTIHFYVCRLNAIWLFYDVNVVTANITPCYDRYDRKRWPLGFNHCSSCLELIKTVYFHTLLTYN